MSPDFLDTKLRNVLGARSATAIEKAFGYTTAGELLGHYPRRYVLRGELTSMNELVLGEDATVVARVVRVTTRRMRARKGNISEVLVQGENPLETMSLSFFNQYNLEQRLPEGSFAMFSGKVNAYMGKVSLAHPDFEIIDEKENAEDISKVPLPLYPAKEKLTSWALHRAIKVVLDMMPDTLEDPIPAQVRAKHRLLSLSQAYQYIHDAQTIQQSYQGQHRMRFQEAFLTQAALVKRKSDNAHHRAIARKPGVLLHTFDQNSPFQLTDSQKQVSAEIAEDLAREQPMNRLLQGDVGSGKTVVALRAMLTAIESGGQAVLLAPTEVLAGQHFQSITHQLGELNFQGVFASLLTGSMGAKQKKKVLLDVATKQCNLLVATHAVLSEKVMFDELALIVIDEQHRFGVDQRDALRQKSSGVYPHVLVMTATPIPRSVAMTVFGDVEVSTLEGLPDGRAAITTHVVNLSITPSWAGRVILRMSEEIAQGRQAYVVCSKIGDEAVIETEDEGIKRYSVLDFADIVHQQLPNARVAILHSRLDTDVKERTMAEFAAGRIDVLVSTTVIEVGVDVHNATMMVILDADRFGVSQLHQLRGRVGRGGLPGLCLLVTQLEAGHDSLERLDAVASTTNGFELSMLDLEQRSEGDVLSARQSGRSSSLKLLKVTRHQKLLEEARVDAIDLIEQDPTLAHHQELAAAISAFFESDSEEYLEKG